MRPSGLQRPGTGALRGCGGNAGDRTVHAVHQNPIEGPEANLAGYGLVGVLETKLPGLQQLPQRLLTDSDMSDAGGFELLHYREWRLAHERGELAHFEIIEAEGDGAIVALDGDAALGDPGGADETEDQ